MTEIILVTSSVIVVLLNLGMLAIAVAHYRHVRKP
jgi:hypothetical protein